MKPFTIYLNHHSHCDLGYTHDLPIVYELQRRYIDDALDLIEKYGDHGDAATFRWTCEVTSVVQHWLRTASSKQVERFLAAAGRGQLEVCALWCNLTPLATLGQLTEMLTPLRQIRDDMGLTVKSAMNSDVNGFSWALAGLLADSGIEGMTMSINEHFGGAPQPFPGLFRWQTPNGKTMPVWSGPTYAHTAWIGFGGPEQAAFLRFRDFITHRNSAGWKQDWLCMQITHPGPQNDNMGPLAHLSPWVKKFNDRFGEEIRLVISTPSRFFSAIQADAASAEVRTGEWNDWWAFGVGSTPSETAYFRDGTTRLEEADLLAQIATPSNHSDLRNRAHSAFAHYIEHTWGADCSVHRPDTEDALVQGKHKEKFAYEAFSLARLLRRDGLSALAAKINAPDGPGLVIYNPSSEPRSESLRVARRFLEASNLPPAAEETSAIKRRWPRDGAYQQFVDRELFGGDPVDELGPFHLPPFGWTVATPEHRAQPADNLRHEGNSISNGSICLSWNPGTFGLSTAESHGRNWAASFFGTLVCEEILGDRASIMRFDDSLTPTTTRRPVWNPAPPLRRHLPDQVNTEVVRQARSIELRQTASLPFTDGVSVRWRISAEHDDIDVEISIRKKPEAKAHAYYFMLPFAMESAQRLLATSGLVIDPDTEVIPNGCPWWSAQEGLAIGNTTGTAYVATLETPMVGFGKLPLGTSQIAGESLAHEGLGWLWLYNNYWETNFRADASGVLRFRSRLRLAAVAPQATTLRETASALRHPLAYHPLPDKSNATTPFDPEGVLFDLPVQDAKLESVAFEDGALRLVITNASLNSTDFVLRSKNLHIDQVEQTDAEGRPLNVLPSPNGEIKVTVAPRTPVFLRLKTSIA